MRLSAPHSRLVSASLLTDATGDPPQVDLTSVPAVEDIRPDISNYQDNRLTHTHTVRPATVSEGGRLCLTPLLHLSRSSTKPGHCPHMQNTGWGVFNVNSLHENSVIFKQSRETFAVNSDCRQRLKMFCPTRSDTMQV